MESLILLFAVQLLFWGVIIFIIMKGLSVIHKEISREKVNTIFNVGKEDHHE